ncbi:MAG: hypothetical protein ABL907_20185 [Hyphomicrobium sp.]
MSDQNAALLLIEYRAKALEAWLSEARPILSSQKHLDRHTAECAYWHSGYHQALQDVLTRLAAANYGHTLDISSSSPAGARDAENFQPA